MSKFNNFVSRSPPDVSKDTRIVAVVGSTSYDGRDSPDADGWFLSDFFLFMALFRGLTRYQTWIMADTCTPQKLIDRWSKYFPLGYAHGDAQFTRKVVVLSQKVIDQNKLANITAVPEDMVKKAFVSRLDEECKTASQQNQRLLVLVFGHGDLSAYGIQLGVKVRKHGISYPLFRQQELDEIVDKYDPNLTLITNACYSGGWAFYTSGILTTTASGSANQSEAWLASTSLSRYGSVWASAVVKTLASRDSPFLRKAIEMPDEKNVDRELSELSYSALTRQILTKLFTGLDKWIFVHKMNFSAQDDDWHLNGFNRAGFPIADYKKQYDALEDFPPRADEDLRTYNRRHPPSIEESEISEKELESIVIDATGNHLFDSIKRAFGGTKRSLSLRVSQQAIDYLDSYPGRDEQGYNTGEHRKLRMSIKNPQPTAKEVRDCLNILEYRTKKMAVAEQLMYLTDVPRVTNAGKDVYGVAYDDMRFSYYLYQKKLRQTMYDQILHLILHSDLFETPLHEQGRDWDKPERYMAASFYMYEDVTVGIVKTKLAAMKKIKQHIVDNATMDVMRSREVRTAARLYFPSIGGRVRSLSPTKQESPARFPEP